MKKRIFPKKSIGKSRDSFALLRGFNPLQKLSKSEIDSFYHARPNTGLNLHVMSFNIRRGTAKDGKNKWMYRRKRVHELFSHYHPDVLGLQEAMDFQISEIRTMLPGYQVVGVGNLGGKQRTAYSHFF